MDIYLDTSALNRLTDLSQQASILLEAAAVRRTLQEIDAGRLRWISSTIVRLEVLRNRNVAQRRLNLELLEGAAVTLAPVATTLKIAATLAGEGVRGLDAIHLAIAIEANIPFLLTTDAQFIRAASRLTSCHTEVVNPVNWVERRLPWLISPKS